MNLFRALLCVSLLQIAWGDTVHLRDRGTEINGIVTFSNGRFQIVAQFKKGPQTISVARDVISEVRFNAAKDNPDDEAPGWMLSLQTDSASTQGQDVVRFWDEKEKDLTCTLQSVTSDSIIIEGGKSFKRSNVREILLK